MNYTDYINSSINVLSGSPKWLDKNWWNDTAGGNHANFSKNNRVVKKVANTDYNNAIYGNPEPEMIEIQAPERGARFIQEDGSEGIIGLDGKTANKGVYRKGVWFPEQTADLTNVKYYRVNK